MKPKATEKNDGRGINFPDDTSRDTGVNGTQGVLAVYRAIQIILAALNKIRAGMSTWAERGSTVDKLQNAVRYLLRSVAGTVVTTGSGETMTVTGNRRTDSSIDCEDSQGMPHVFSVEGKALCSRFQGYDCSHGDLTPTAAEPIATSDQDRLLYLTPEETVCQNPYAYVRGFQSPSVAQWEALVSFAARHGRTWKSKLRQAWFDGQYPSMYDASNYLQQIRNGFGPTWLQSIRIPADLIRYTRATTMDVHGNPLPSAVIVARANATGTAYTAPVTAADAEELTDPTVVTALPFRHDTMNACTCGEGDAPGLAHCEGCALHVPVTATVEDERRIEAERADAFNARVWDSPEMREAFAGIDEAREQLATGKGWGLLALESAEEHLRAALACIARMKAMKAMKGGN